MKKLIYIFPFMVIFELIFAQSCVKMRTSDKEALAEFRQKQLNIVFNDVIAPKCTMHYAKIGADTLPTLFFVHGSPGSWDAFKSYLLDKDLRKSFRLISIDRPGFGYSDFGDALHLSDQAMAIYEVIKKEDNHRKIHLIGHSIGGPVIVKLAQDHPNAYASLTILAGSISPYHEPAEKWRKYFLNFPLKYLLPGALRPSNKEIFYFKKDLYEMDTCYNRLKMPITFIHGDKDPLVTIQNVSYGTQKLAANTAIKTIILPNANHFIPWQHFKEIKAHLLTLNQ